MSPPENLRRFVVAPPGAPTDAMRQKGRLSTNRTEPYPHQARSTTPTSRKDPLPWTDWFAVMNKNQNLHVPENKTANEYLEMLEPNIRTMFIERMNTELQQLYSKEFDERFIRTRILFTTLYERGGTAIAARVTDQLYSIGFYKIKDPMRTFNAKKFLLMLNLGVLDRERYTTADNAKLIAMENDNFVTENNSIPMVLHTALWSSENGYLINAFDSEEGTGLSKQFVSDIWFYHQFFSRMDKLSKLELFVVWGVKEFPIYLDELAYCITAQIQDVVDATFLRAARALTPDGKKRREIRDTQNLLKIVGAQKRLWAVTGYKLKHYVFRNIPLEEFELQTRFHARRVKERFEICINEARGSIGQLELVETIRCKLDALEVKSGVNDQDNQNNHKWVETFGKTLLQHSMDTIWKVDAVLLDVCGEESMGIRCVDSPFDAIVRDTRLGQITGDFEFEFENNPGGFGFIKLFKTNLEKAQDFRRILLKANRADEKFFDFLERLNAYTEPDRIWFQREYSKHWRLLELAKKNKRDSDAAACITDSMIDLSETETYQNLPPSEDKELSFFAMFQNLSYQRYSKTMAAEQKVDVIKVSDMFGEDEDDEDDEDDENDENDENQ